MKNKNKTNKQLLNEMFMHSQAGVLKQAFIMEAIAHYAQAVLTDKSDWGNSFISKDAWQLCAKECLDTLKEHR
jgi:hypothetical protein